MVLAAGCTGDRESAGSQPPTSTSPSTGVDMRFMRLDDGSWQLKEAIRPLTKTGRWAELEPSLDWWAEYERFEPITGGVEGLDVRLSGHHADLEVQTVELTGFTVEPALVGDRRAMIATGPDGEPVTVSIDVSAGYTVMALSYALNADELVRVAAELDVVTFDEWTADGGRVVPCAPLAADCATTSTT
jgi:hypothetical protein